MALTAALSALAGGLNNRPTTTTSTQSGTSTTARNLSPQQQILMNLMGPTISQMITNPMASLAPLQTAANEQVNANYAQAPQAIRDQFMSSGGAASGKSGMATIQEQLARQGALAGVAANTETAAANRQVTAEGLAQNLLNTNLGSTTTGSGTGTTVQSGNEAGGALSAGLSSLTSLLSIGSLLNGSDSGSSGGGSSLVPSSGGSYTPAPSTGGTGPASSSVDNAYFGGF
jgi:hypothetical protein